MSADEKIHEITRRESGMGLDEIAEVGDRVSEWQAAGVYGAGFTAGFLARKGAKGGIRGMGNKVSSDKELTKVEGMAEDDWGGTGKKFASGGVR